MADESEGLNVNIGASLAGLTSGLKDGLSQINSFAGNAQGAFGGLGGALSAMKGPLLAITGLLAGGALFKSAVDATVEWTKRVKDLSNSLGLALEATSVYAKVLQDLGVDTGTIARTSQILTMRIEQQALKFERLGIHSRDASGRLRPMAEVMTQVAEKARSFNDVADRNAFLAATLGRSWRSFLPVLKVTEERLAEASNELKQFGIVVTKDGVKAVEEYQISMRNTGDALDAVKIRIGMQLMPTLSAMAKEVSRLGLEVFPVITQALEGLGMAFNFVIYVVKLAWASFKEILLVVFRLAEGFVVLWDAVEKAASGDFTGAGQRLKEGLGKVWEDIKQDSIDAGVAMNKAADEFAASIMASYERLTGTAPKPKPETPKPEGSGEGYVSDRSKELMEKAKAEELKLLEKHGKLTAEQELELWSKWLDIARAGGAMYENAYEGLLRRVSGLHETQTNRIKEQRFSEIDVETQLGHQSAQARFDAEKAKYDITVKQHGAESDEAVAHWNKLLLAGKAYNDAVAAMNEQARAHKEALSLSRLEAEEQAVMAEMEISVMSKDSMIAAQEDFERRRYEIRLKGVDDQLALAEGDEARTQELQRQRESMELDHENKLADIRRTGLARMQADVTTYLAPIRGAFNELFDGILNKQVNMAKILDQLWKGLAKTIIGALIDIMVKGIAALIAESIVGRATAVSAVSQNAAVAASKAAASVAGVPFAGPALAAAAFASTMALVMGGAMPLALAARGYDIGNENPIVQLHKREMVLPERHAETIRRLGETDGGGGGGPLNLAVNFNLSGMDGASVYRTFKEHEHEIVKALTEAVSSNRLRLQPR